MKSYLEDFMISNFSGEQLLQKIKDFRLEFILVDLIRRLDENLYEKVIERMKDQKNDNELFYHEMKELADAFNKEGVSLVFFKGYLLAHDLYDPIESRSSGDIDVLVKVDDVEKALEIIGDRGYLQYQDKKPITKEFVSKLENVLLKGIHFPPFIKYKKWNSKEVSIDMDFHVSIFHLYDNKAEAMKKLVDRSTTYRIGNSPFQVLELHDRFLHLLSHFTKEYFKVESTEMLVGSRGEAFLKIKLLYDIALFLNKYNKEFKWETFMDRIVELDRAGDMLFPLLILNEIFPGYVQTGILAQLRKLTKVVDKSFMGQVLPIAVDMNPKKFLLESPKKIIPELLDKVKIWGPEITSSSKSDSEEENTTGEIIIDDFSPNIQNVFKTNYKAGIRPKTSLESSAYGKVWWTPENLHFRIRIYDNAMVNSDTQSLPALIFSFSSSDESDYIDHFRYYTYKYIFTPIREDNSIYLKYSRMIKGQDLEIYRGNHSIQLSPDGYEIDLDIPWGLLGFNPYKGKKILCDLNVRFYGESGELGRTLLAWANIEGLNEPTYYGVINLG